jgi:hypothetical protein
LKSGVYHAGFAAIRKLDYQGNVRRRIVQKDFVSIFLVVAQPFAVVTDNDDTELSYRFLSFRKLMK